MLFRHLESTASQGSEPQRESGYYLDGTDWAPTPPMGEPLSEEQLYEATDGMEDIDYELVMDALARTVVPKTEDLAA
jgi:hypothetical protein